MSYPENIKTFLTEIADYIETPTESKGVLFVPIKKSIFRNPDIFIPFIHGKIDVLKDNPNWKKYCSFSICYPIGFTIDLALVHRERLAQVFNKISKEETQESIKFLSEIGWTDEQFQREYEVSGITLYRYRRGKFQQRKATKAAEPGGGCLDGSQ